MIALAFLLLVAAAVLVKAAPTGVIALYLVSSLFTFFIYAIDKSAARKGQWRTQESTLHFLSLLGGWPGAIVAQQRLRHKSQKRPFRAIFWLTVLVNCGIFFWLLFPEMAALPIKWFNHL